MLVLLAVGLTAARAEAACLAGTEVGGACWFLGDVGQSCAAVCDAAGFPYDEATRTSAGSDGTNGNCVGVLDALGVPGSAVQDLICDEDAGIGCTFEPDLMAAGRIRCTRPTLADAFVDGVQRACACQSRAPVLQAPLLGTNGMSVLLAALLGLGAWGLRRRGAVLSVLLLSIVTLPFFGCGGDDGPTSGVSTNQYTLVWSDEFNGSVGTGVDPANWIHDLGTGYPGGPANWGTGEVAVRPRGSRHSTEGRLR